MFKLNLCFRQRTVFRLAGVAKQVVPMAALQRDTAARAEFRSRIGVAGLGSVAAHSDRNLRAELPRVDHRRTRRLLSVHGPLAHLRHARVRRLRLHRLSWFVSHC